MIRWFKRENATQLLGPGLRGVLWVQGCPHHCPGCLLESTVHNKSETKVSSPQEMARWFLDTGCTGLTISGGEPFQQSSELAAMIQEIRRQKDITVMIYTGYVFEDLQTMADPGVQELLAQTDLLIDGPYIQTLDNGLFARGSSNQRLIELTSRIDNAEIETYFNSRRPREISMSMAEDSISFVGVPSAQQLRLWKSITH